MDPYIKYQLEKHGNYVGADGLLHTAEDAHMVDENIDFENGFVTAEELSQWFQQQAELQREEIIH